MSETKRAGAERIEAGEFDYDSADYNTIRDMVRGGMRATTILKMLADVLGDEEAVDADDPRTALIAYEIEETAKRTAEMEEPFEEE